MKCTRQRCQLAEHLGDGGLDAVVGVRHDQLDAAQAAAGQLAQERRPSQPRRDQGDLQMLAELRAPSEVARPAPSVAAAEIASTQQWQ